MRIVYGSRLCPDCVQCCEDLKNAGIPFEYRDFSDDLRHLKAFLELRDTLPVFEEAKTNGKIGIPCIVDDMGNVRLTWREDM